jgi:polyhydroxybutyrate depolymerase
MMAYRLACELSEKIAGIAPVAGAMNVGCRPASPVSLVAFHGTADLHVLYEGGRPKRTVDYHARSDTSVADAVSFWAKRDGCGPAPERQKKGSVTTEFYADCTAGTGVALYSIEGGGHVWPGGKKGFLEIGEPAHEISATDIIWEFFNNHPKP